MVEHEFAYRDGFIVSAEDADKGVDHRCPGCNDILRPRSGPKTTPHFYHLKTKECTASKESILHSNSKYLLYLRLQKYLQNGKNLKCFLKCISDGIEYDYIKYGIGGSNGEYALNTLVPKNLKKEILLLDNVDDIELEKKHDNLIPDISLLKNKNLVKSIEIVHTHDDDDSKKEEYRKKGIDVLYVYIENNLDYEILKECVTSIDESISKYVLNYGKGCGYTVVTTIEMLNSNFDKKQIAKYRENIKRQLESNRDLEYKQKYQEITKKKSKLNEYTNNSFSITELQNRYIGPSLTDNLKKYKYLLDEIENNSYDHFWTISGIARQCDIGGFNEKVTILEYFIDNGLIAIINHKYVIHKKLIHKMLL
ncbi:competence protein CoiA family protein [Methanococcoides seepicolus]|uniref:Competence protein CoiA-like N-terminal domain-containing protein n=1 Tax=Methanococcoides seepicolus TaxID=2828780 RepID=A0A9E4ZBB5_9EURY|nr:competence protein CoiA family protein [Methanococcoides seepicolus]MCM1985611.1 hypothetical protein [Methanococcoides seepicolus]